jgi:protein SCO1/2
MKVTLALAAALLAASLTSPLAAREGIAATAAANPSPGGDRGGDRSGEAGPAMPCHQEAKPEPGPAAAQPAQPALALEVPDVAVIDQDGKPLRFYSDLIQGKTVALNFVFTTCTTVCPPMGANFAKLQKLLGEKGGPDVSLISVSVDPATDTPQRMKEWGAKFGAGPGWTLVTGDRAVVTQLLKALGVFSGDKADHSPLVLIGNDRTRSWTRTYGLTPPSKLAELISQIGQIGQAGGVAAHGKQTP